MKSRPSPFLRFSTAAAAASLALLGSTTAQAADLTWNAALPGDWNTSNTNWSGSTWNNSTPDNAILNNLSGTITLTQDITAGSLSFSAAGRESGAHYLTLTGSSSLSLASIGVVGTGLGGNVDSIGEAYNQRLTFENMTVNVSGNAAVGRGMLYLNGATMNVGGTILSNNAWNVFRADNSTVTATGGIDFSAIASAVELYGGTITTPFIKVGNATWDGASGLYFSAVTLVATQDTADFIQVYNNGDTNSRAGARIYGNGMTLNSNGHAVTIDTALFGDGFLTKTGAGTLTLAQANTYTGNTSVNAGTLEISATGKLYNGGYTNGPVVTVASGATLRLNEWNYDAAGSLGKLDFSRDLLVVNGGMIEYAGNSNDGSNGGAAGRNFTIGTGGATLNVTTAGQTWTIADNASYGALVNDNGLTLGGVGDGVIAKAISGTGALTKNGAGTWTLTGANTYTGTTTVNEGTLQLGASSSYNPQFGALENSSLLTIEAGATVRAMGANAFKGFSGGSMDVTLNGGTLTLNDGVTEGGNHGLGTVTLNGGTISGVGSATWGGFNLNGPVNVTEDSTISATNTNTNGTDKTITVSAGKTLDWTGTISNRGFDNAATSLTFAGAGTTVLSGANTYTGTTTVSAGTLAISGSGSIANSSTIEIASGAILDVSSAAGFTVGSAHSLIGSGTVKGQITVDGTLGIGASPGTMTFEDGLNLGSSSVSNFEFTLAAFSAGSYDLAFSDIGSVNFGGILNLYFDSGESYLEDSMVQIFDFGGGYSGGFSQVNYFGLGAGQSATFDVSTGIVTVVPEPGAALLGSLGMLVLLRRRR